MCLCGSVVSLAGAAVGQVVGHQAAAVLIAHDDHVVGRVDGHAVERGMRVVHEPRRRHVAANRLLAGPARWRPRVRCGGLRRGGAGLIGGFDAWPETDFSRLHRFEHRQYRFRRDWRPADAWKRQGEQAHWHGDQTFHRHSSRSRFVMSTARLDLRRVDCRPTTAAAVPLPKISGTWNVSTALSSLSEAITA